MGARRRQARAGIGGFAQTPDAPNRLQPGRKRLSFARKEAVLACWQSGGSINQAPGVIWRQEQKPSESSRLPGSPQSEAEAGWSARGRCTSPSGRGRGGGTRPPPHPEDAPVSRTTKGEKGRGYAGSWESVCRGRGVARLPSSVGACLVPKPTPVPPPALRSEPRAPYWTQKRAARYCGPARGRLRRTDPGRPGACSGPARVSMVPPSQQPEAREKPGLRRPQPFEWGKEGRPGSRCNTAALGLPRGSQPKKGKRGPPWVNTNIDLIFTTYRPSPPHAGGAWGPRPPPKLRAQGEGWERPSHPFPPRSQQFRWQKMAQAWFLSPVK